VVIDTPANFSNATLGAINVADDVLVLAGLDVMSLKSARVGLETLRVMGVPLTKVKFVLNRANTKVGLTERDAQRAVQLEIDAALPSDIVVAESVNRGVPVVMSTPRSRFARVIDDLAKRLMVPENSSDVPAETS
jgi:pilus assembly protein CpaE